MNGRFARNRIASCAETTNPPVPASAATVTAASGANTPVWQVPPNPPPADNPPCPLGASTDNRSKLACQDPSEQRMTAHLQEPLDGVSTSGVFTDSVLSYAARRSGVSLVIAKIKELGCTPGL